MPINKLLTSYTTEELKDLRSFTSTNIIDYKNTINHYKNELTKLNDLTKRSNDLLIKIEVLLNERKENGY
jgi:hypothetical protein